MAHSGKLFVIIFIIIAIIVGMSLFLYLSINLTSLGQARGSYSVEIEPQKNIIVFSPLAGEVVEAKDFNVRGSARVFENQFQVRVKKGEKLLFEALATSSATDAGQFGNFTVPIKIEKSMALNGGQLLLEVFDLSPMDSREVDKISVQFFIKF